MKKVLLLCAVFALCSCVKENPETGKVSFSYSLIESGSMTRTLSADVQSALSSRKPEVLKLRLTSDAGKYEVETGQEIVLPLGRYEVTGGHSPKASQQVKGMLNYLSESPMISVKDAVEVSNLQKVYKVSATFQCFAIAIDLNEVEKAEFYTSSGNEAVRFITSGNIGYIFAVGSFDAYPLRLTIYPREKVGYEPKTYILTDNRANEGVYVEKGKFYLFHPAQVEESAIGISYDPGKWTAGNE